MKRFLSLTLAAAMALSLLTGCAETPESPVVLQKDQEQLLETANSLEDSSTTIASQTNAPKTYQSSFSNEDGTFTVTVDAAVTLPDTDNAKIIRVTDHEITQEEVDAWTEYFFGDQPLYTEGSLVDETKEELQAMLLQLQQSLTKLEAAGEGPSSAAVEYSVDSSSVDEDDAEETAAVEWNQADEIRNAIEVYQNSIAEAPEERTPVETTNKLTDQHNWGYTSMKFAVENDDKTGIRSMSADNYPGFKQIWYIDHGEREYGNADNYMTYEDILQSINWESEEELAEDEFYQALQTLPEPEISEADAQKLAEEFITACGLEEFALQETEQVFIGPSSYLVDNTPMGNSLKGWGFLYQRMIDGIPVAHPGIQAAAPDEDSFWAYERLHIIVNDDGIVEVYYISPYDIGETLSENCKLMDFDSVIEIFHKMMNIASGENYGGDILTILQHDFQITDIRFGYTRITEQNTDYSGLLVPTWSFWGSEHYLGEYTDGTIYDNTFEAESPLLVINAIDGSVINIDAGY